MPCGGSPCLQGPPARGLGIAHNRRVLRVPSGPNKLRVLFCFLFVFLLPHNEEPPKMSYFKVDRCDPGPGVETQKGSLPEQPNMVSRTVSYSFGNTHLISGRKGFHVFEPFNLKLDSSKTSDLIESIFFGFPFWIRPYHG